MSAPAAAAAPLWFACAACRRPVLPAADPVVFLAANRPACPHVACRGCASPAGNKRRLDQACPAPGCGAEWDALGQLRDQAFAWSVYLDSVVDCPSGCGTKERVAQLEAHRRRCAGKMCPGCGYRSGWGADPADADRHVEACPDVPIECANPGCGAKVPRRLAPEHQSSCPKRIVTCPFSLCTHQCTADTLKCHTDASQEEHHNLAAAALSDLRQELTAQLQEAEALQRERMAAACSQVVRILVGTEETGLPPAPLPTECKPASKTTESGTKYMSAPFVFSGVRFTLMAKFDDVRDTYAVFIRLGPGGRHAWAEVKWSFCFVNPLAGGGTRREQRALLANDEKGVGFLTIANKAQVLDPAEGFLEEIKGLKYLVFRVSMYVKDAVLEVDARGDTRRTKTLKDEAEWPEAPF